MHIDVLSVTIREGFTAFKAPPEVGVIAVEDYISHYPYSLLYICGNRSKILTKVKGEFEVRRAFTVYQLFSILEELHHSATFIEHDPLIFEEDEDVIDAFSLALRDSGRGKMVIYFSTSHDRFFDRIVLNSNRVLVVEREPGGYFIADLKSERFYKFLPKCQTIFKTF
jgi:DNA polymerase I